MAVEEDPDPAPAHRSQPYRPLRRAAAPIERTDEQRAPLVPADDLAWLDLVELALDWQGLPCRQ